MCLFNRMVLGLLFSESLFFVAGSWMCRVESWMCRVESWTYRAESCNSRHWVLQSVEFCPAIYDGFFIVFNRSLCLFCSLSLSRFVVAGGSLACFLEGAYCITYTIGFCGFCACFCFCVSRADEGGFLSFLQGWNLSVLFMLSPPFYRGFNILGTLFWGSFENGFGGVSGRGNLRYGWSRFG